VRPLGGASTHSAPRDLSIALEYGCQDSELLDFLLVLHTEDEAAARKKDADKVDTAIETMRSAKLDMQHASAGDIGQWAADIRQNLTKALQLKRNTPASKKIKDDILKNIIQSIRNASEKSNLDENLEIEELEVPVLKGREVSTALAMAAPQIRTRCVRPSLRPPGSPRTRTRGGRCSPGVPSRYGPGALFLSAPAGLVTGRVITRR
jgi:hypothetical protein